MAALAATLKTALTLKQKMQQENNSRYRAADYDVPLRKNAKQSVNRKKGNHRGRAAIFTVPSKFP